MRLARALGIRFNGNDMFEVKYNGHIVWPIYQIQTYPLPELFFNAVGGEREMYVSLYAYNEDGDQIRVDSDIDASRLTITKVSSSLDPYNQITYEKVLVGNKYRLVFKGAYLDTNERAQASAIFRISVAGNDTTLDVQITQEANVAQVTPQHEETTAYGGLTYYMGEDYSEQISVVPPAGGNVRVLGVQTYSIIAERTDYTSGAHTGGGVISSGHLRPRVPTSLSIAPALAPPYGISDDIIDFAPNERNESQLDYVVTGYYTDPVTAITFSGTGDIAVDADYIKGQEQVVDQDSYEAYVDFSGSENLTPEGYDYDHQALLQARALHEEYIVNRWASGAADVLSNFAVYDSFTVNKFESGTTPGDNFWLGAWTQTPDENGYYYAQIFHSGMRDREYDKVKFVCENNEHTEAQWETSEISIHNGIKSQTEADIFSLAFQDDYVAGTGGNVRVDYVAVRSRVTIYDSDYRSEVDAINYQVNLAANYGTFSESAVGGRGSTTLSVPANGTFANRTIRADMYYTGSQSVAHDDSLTQGPHPPIYTLDLDHTSWIFYASGRSPAGSTFPLHVYGVMTDGEGEHTVDLPASALTIVKSGDPRSQISRAGLDFSAANLGTNPYDYMTCQYSISWDDHPEATVIFIAGQEANRVEETIVAHAEVVAFGYLSFSPSVIPVTGGWVTVTGRATYENVADEYIWTSNAHSGGGRTPAGTATVNPDLTCPGGEVSGNTIYFYGNEHSTSSPVFVVTASFGGFSASANLVQEPDSYTDTTRSHGYYAEMTLYNSNLLTAAGGSCGYSATGGHYVETTRTWHSDQYSEVISDVPVSDTCSVYKSGTGAAYFHVIGDDTIEHDNMLRRDIDAVTFTAVNDNDATATDSASVTVYNGSETTARNEFSLSLSSVRVPAAGDVVDVYYSCHHIETTEYDSGTEDTVTTDLTATLTATLGTLASSGATGTGSTTLTVPANTSYSGRAGFVSIYYGSHEEQFILFEQDGAPRPYEDYIIVTDSPTALGRTVYFENTYSAELLTTVELEFTNQDTGTTFTTQWVGRIGAGATASQFYEGYGYGYDLTPTVISAQP